MLALSYLKNLDGVLLPSKPTGRLKDDWGMAFEKAVDNKGTRTMKVDRYIAKTNSYDALKKAKHEVAITTDNDVENAPKGNLTLDYASYVHSKTVGAASAVDSLADLELADLVVEFFEQQEMLLAEGISLFPIVEGLITNALEGKSTEKYLEQVEDLNVTDMVKDIIMMNAFPEIKERFERQFSRQQVSNVQTIEIEALAV